MDTPGSIIEKLIGTFRELNLRVRPANEETLSASRSGESVRGIVNRMRSDELRFAQALKERLTGVPMPEMFGDDTPIIGTESEHDSTALIISQFGSARATTLTMLRELSDEEWNTPVEGGTTIRARVQELVDNDAQQLDRINSLLGSRV